MTRTLALALFFDSLQSWSYRGSTVVLSVVVRLNLAADSELPYS